MTLRRGSTAVLLTLIGTAVLVLPGSALATTGHTFVGQFGGSGTGDGQFSEPLGSGPAGIAVMPSTGDVFGAGNVGVGGSTFVQRFNAAGAFQSKFAVDPSYIPTGTIAADPAGTGAVYVSAFGGASPSAVLKYSAAGVFDYTLDASSSGTTVDNPFSVYGDPLTVDPANGTVYVAATDDTTGAQVIDTFDQSTGAFIASFDGSDSSPDLGFACPSSLAVDASHDLYVLDACKNGSGRVDEYSASGTWLATVDDGSRGAPSAVAADPTSGDVYVSEAGPVGLQITQFAAATFAPIYTFDASNVAGVRAMAVSGDGTLYTSDATTPFVERFAAFDGPTVVTGSTCTPDTGTAAVNGTIDPEGVASKYHFDYGTDFRYGSRTDDADAGAGTSDVPATAVLTGLEPNLTYYYRIVGSNDSGVIVGAAATCMTLPVPATLGDSAFASAITPRTARLHGTYNAQNGTSFGNWHIDYGTTTDYGASTGGGLIFGATAGDSDHPVAEQLSGLQPDTVYHFRVVADNGTGGPQQGDDHTFITAPAAGGGAIGVTTRRATLHGTINAHGASTTYHFNYGPTSGYGANTPEVDGGAGDGDQTVAQQISGLLPSTTYHVQVVATTGGVVPAIRTGADGLFKTPPAPTATAISPASVSTSSATLVGDAETHGQPGTYHFDVSSLDSSYTSSSPEQPTPGGVAADRVTAPTSGLPSGETFVVRLTVTSNDSIDVSGQITFATAPLPRVFPTAPIGVGTSAYGCGAPGLDAYNAKPRPGDTITVTGHDLGFGGNAVLGAQSFTPTGWSANGFTVQVPDDATGTLPLTVNCGHQSNTIAIAIFHEPDNAFTIPKRSVSGSTATLSVKVPGPGKLETSGTKTKATKTAVAKAATVTVRVQLTSAGATALAKAKGRSLKVAVRVRFTPVGGKAATKTVAITLKRKAGR